ncbi:MAG: M48 family metalloprotease [Saprospiraceae bacterium]|nr:M48 family metalloprotease [Saprospiraceae bacterium]
MNWLQNILPPNWTYALGWTVIHSLWQGVVIASVMAFAMMGLQKKTAVLRYRIAYGSLLSMLLCAIVTFIFLLKKTTDSTPDDFYESLILRGLIFEATDDNQSILERISLFFNENLYLIVTIWLMGVAFFSLRLLGGLMYVQQLRSRHLMFLPADWQSRMNFFKHKVGVRYAVELAESAMVSVPMVIGWLKPLILLPIGTINNMSVAQVEAILAHELTHIANRDFVLNILQSIIEILFYYHPAAWWISANIRTERENRCDDVAVQLCGSSLTYAKALLSLQEMQLQNVRTYGLAMTLAGKNKNFLLNRIKRILNQPQNRSNIMEKLTATALLLAVVTALSFGNNKTVTRSQSDTSDLSTPSVLTDTLPPKGKITIKKEDDGGKSVELKVENGNITQLKIDGKDIPKEDYDKYEDLTDDLLYGMPTPPTPPTPPMPPTPPTPFSAPLPPTPPVPPVAPFGSRTSLKKEKDSDGNTILKMKKADGSYSEIKITPDKEVYVDGKKMEEGKDLKLNLGDNGYYFFDSKGKSFSFADGFDNFDLKLDNHFDLVMPKIKIKSLSDDILKHPRSYYFLDGDSSGVFHLSSDSAKLNKLKSKLYYNYNFNWSDDDVVRIKENAKRLSEEGIRSADRYRKDAERLERDAQRLSQEKQKLAQEQRENYQRNVERLHRDAQRMAQERQKLAQERMQEQRQNREEMIRDRRAEISEAKKVFERELIKDGFLKEGEKKYTFELTDKQLKINGKEQSSEMHEKYVRLYKEKLGFRSDRNFSINFNEN